MRIYIDTLIVPLISKATLDIIRKAGNEIVFPYDEEVSTAQADVTKVAKERKCQGILNANGTVTVIDLDS